MLKNLLQNQQNLIARGIYSCTGIYFFKSASDNIPKRLFDFVSMIVSITYIHLYAFLHLKNYVSDITV